MRHLIAVSAFAVLAGVLALPTFAQDAATQPAEAMTVTVKSIAGKSAYWLDTTVQKAKWARLATGQKLPEGAIVRTGFRTEVTLAFADKSDVVIEAASKIGVTEFRKSGGQTKTYLKGKYGAVRATIHRDKGPNDFRIVTPVATCAAMGTFGRINLAGLAQTMGAADAVIVTGKSGVWVLFRGAGQKDVKGGEVSNGTMNSVDIQRMMDDLRLINWDDGFSDVERALLDRWGGGRNYFVMLGFRPFSTYFQIICVRNGQHIEE